MSTGLVKYTVVEPLAIDVLQDLAHKAGQKNTVFHIRTQKQQTDEEYRRGVPAVGRDWAFRTESICYAENSHIVVQDDVTKRIVRIETDRMRNLMTITAT
ncbi:hypothetical protein EON76_01800 [bacterium]|nr:MAG: hypothetical protein EON76_01800 [bacterium]